MSVDIRGPALARLAAAIGEAFPRPTMLAQFVEYRLGKNLYDYVGEKGVKEMVFELLVAARGDGWLDDLVVSARAEKPGNAAIGDVAEEVGLAPAGSGGPRLERLVRESATMLAPAAFRDGLAAAEAAVCVIATPTVTGTGFLVGPDLVLTNRHVIADLIDGAIAPADVTCTFDFRRWKAPGRRDGTAVALAADWRVDDSPHDDGDLDDPPRAPAPEHLDHALVRVAARIGEAPVGKTADPSARPRGWLAPAAHDFAKDSPLFIVQHPRGKPVALALDTSAVIELDAARTRVRYRTGTEDGSSGSPCFDQAWRLVALHHAGDPAWVAKWNQGIPIMRIVERLRARAIELPPPP